MDYDYSNQILIYGTIENLSVFKTNFDLGWENVFNKKLIAKSEGFTKILNEPYCIAISYRFDLKEKSVSSKHFPFKEWINIFDEFDIHSIDESEKLCLYFGTYHGNTPSVRFYQLLAALYPNLRFEIDIQLFESFHNLEFGFENGKIVKHTRDYLDEDDPKNAKHCRENRINKTVQVVAEHIFDEIEESVDAPEKAVLPSTTGDFGLDNDDFLKELGKLKHGHYKVVRCS
jgi:hypothetical protein